MVVALPILVAAYGVLVEWWRRALPSSPKEHGCGAARKVSVVIAARNEAGNITKILSDLKAQTYPDFEVIVVDDHSDDDTFALCECVAADFPQLRILKNPSEGKKSAVAAGVKLAEGDVVLTTDADCRVQRNWIASVVADFEEYNADILASPVDMVDVSSASQTLFKRLQRLEFMSLQASTAGGICRNHATMCNSANLAFKRSLYDASAFDGNDIMSGDDVFFLHHVKRSGGRIAFSFSPDSTVYTLPNETLSAFFSQRARWAGKATSYKDTDTIATAIVVLLANLSIIASAVGACLSLQYLYLFVLLFAVKALADFAFLRTYAKRVGMAGVVSPFEVVILSVVYPFYVLVSAFRGLLPNSWKGRRM
ncbi:MAG: glycosyltransferase [Paludibacteraceae bacterium]|nr:glycosyltransferase [Paludibacteraceae bacterium]MBQ6962765.1 glycosyltransferase [Paludibacteraceae bacterium]MBQ7748523.1 glycosyltransferase [Paludibacteraceae bacterium]